MIQESRLGISNVVHETGPKEERVPIRGSSPGPITLWPPGHYLFSLALRAFVRTEPPEDRQEWPEILQRK